MSRIRGKICYATNNVEHNHLTKEVSQIDLVTLAVYALGGERRAIDTEDVAVKAHEMAPTRFSWRKYPQQINLELIRVYLSAAKNPAKGGLLDGSGTIGWTLTPKGLRWAKEEGTRLLEAGHLDRPREEAGGGSIGEQRWRRERERILGTVAWSRWTGGEEDVAVRDAQDVFRIDSYAVGRMKTLKISRLRSLFDSDPEVSSFLTQMADILDATGED